MKEEGMHAGKDSFAFQPSQLWKDNISYPDR